MACLLSGTSILNIKVKNIRHAAPQKGNLEAIPGVLFTKFLLKVKKINIIIKKNQYTR